MQTSEAGKFTILNTFDGLTSSKEQIFTFIQKNLPENADARINFKAEVIVTELLTNSLKHNQKLDSFLQVLIDDDTILIEKTDFGAPLILANLKSLINVPSGYKAELYKDAIHTMYAEVVDRNKLRFICEENKLDKAIDFNNIMEHFGLLIITKSSEEFTYYYDHLLQMNTFNVKLKLH